MRKSELATLALWVGVAALSACGGEREAREREGEGEVPSAARPPSATAAAPAVEEETTILLASHRFSDVEAVAGRLLVLHQGRLAFDGRLADLRQAVEAASTLWLKVPAACREAAARRLAARYPGTLVPGNGLGLRVPAQERAAALSALEEAGIPVESLWTETPSLHQILQHTLGLDAPPEEGASS
jgi:ABC-type uncharacterized transport system ATPase subunit